MYYLCGHIQTAGWLCLPTRTHLNGREKLMPMGNESSHGFYSHALIISPQTFNHQFIVM